MKLLLALTILFLAACASNPKPVLMPNRKYEKVGASKANRDINACMIKADKHLESGREERKRRSAMSGAAGGAVVGGVAGLMSSSHNIGGGVATGAVVGGGVGYLKGGDNPEARKNIVNECLIDKGYKIAGWD